MVYVMPNANLNACYGNKQTTLLFPVQQLQNLQYRMASVRHLFCRLAIPKAENRWARRQSQPLTSLSTTPPPLLLPFHLYPLLLPHKKLPESTDHAAPRPILAIFVRYGYWDLSAISLLLIVIILLLIVIILLLIVIILLWASWVCHFSSWHANNFLETKSQSSLMIINSFWQITESLPSTQGLDPVNLLRRIRYRISR